MNAGATEIEDGGCFSGYDVTIFLDESMVEVCIVHDACPKKGDKDADKCSKLYLYGVGASVFESSDDRRYAIGKLANIRSLIAIRGGVSASKRMDRFVADGWHATEDLPEFADPLIHEVDLNSAHKGHVRYLVSNQKVDSGAAHAQLFINVLRPILQRYSQAASIQVTYEKSDEMKDAKCREIIDAAGGKEIPFSRESKGSDLLAIADYLLFASMRYVARNEQLCAREGCGQRHKMPIGATVEFDSEGRLLPVGHVGGEDRWHKLYFSFVRSMSSFVRYTKYQLI